MKTSCPALITALLLLGLPPLPAWADGDAPRRTLRRADLAEAAPVDPSTQASLLRREAIERLKPLIESAPASQKPELILRLAELYYEEGRWLRYRPAEDGAEDAAIAQSEEWYASALRLYRLLAERYPQHPRAAEGDFALAATLEELGRPDEALLAWSRFLAAHPDAPGAAEGYLRLGELLFDRGEVFKARQAYTASLRIEPQARLAGYARFRLAWCDYNLGEYEAAIQGLRAVALSAAEEDAALPLREEAARDLMRVVAETQPVEAVREEAARLRVPAAERRALLARAAEVKRTVGEDADAERLWLGVIDEAPEDPAAGGYARAIVEMHLQAARYGAAMASLERMPAALRADAGSPALLARIAASAHQEARKRRQGALYEVAGRAYAAWLEQAASSAAAPEAEVEAAIRYGYGELLYERGAYAEAYAQYSAVAALGGEHAAFSAEAAVFAAEKLLAAEPSARDAAVGGAPVPLSPAAARYLEAAARLLVVQPGHARTQALLYRSAYLLYHHNHLDEAAARFREVVAMDPRSAEAQQASHLILDGLAQQGAWVALRDTARAFREAEGLGDARFRAELEEIHERAAFKVIEVEAETAPGSAAEGWVGFALAHPDSPLAPTALNNAAVAFRQVQRRADAIEARELLLARHPDSPYAPDQTAALGADYESMADFARAAEWYERLAARFPAHTDAADALYSAILFRQALGQPEAALADMDAFLAAFAADARGPGLALERAALLVAQGALPAAATAYRAFAEAPPAGASAAQALHARVALGEVLLVQGQVRPARAAWERAVADAAATGGDEVRAAQAEALCRLARLERAALEGMAMRSWQTVQQDFLQMSRAFVRVEAAYTAAIQVGELRWGLTAASELGQSYERLADALLRSPRPPGEEGWVQVYEEGIQARAWTLQYKAIALYTEVMERSFEVQFYEEPAAIALGRLQALDPEAWPALSEDILRAAFTSDPGTGLGFRETPE